MGKRRDRRHAVLGGGGRRMKLDLGNDENEDVAAAVAEGKCNMSGISDTVEEGGESDERLSPHSLPGPVQVNPLSLLGQYSDDDGEGEEQMNANGSSGGFRAVAVPGQVDEQVASFLADLETSGLLKDDIVSHEDGMEAEGAKQEKCPQEVDTKDMEVLCDWEAVLHKETSEYYYWNKVTGETTWEKPANYMENEALKGRDLQDGLETDSKRSLQYQHSRSEPAHEEEAVSRVDNSAMQELKNNKLLEERCVVDLVQGGQLKDGGCEVMSVEHAEKQDAGCDNEDVKEADIRLETRESIERADCSPGNTVKSLSESQDDPELSAHAAVIVHGAGDSFQVEQSTALNIVEDGKGGEDINTADGSPFSGSVEDDPSTVDRADASGSENPSLRNVTVQARRYDHHRLIERGEVLAQEFKMLAGEALRCLSLRLRLAVESEVRLSDCKAMAMHDLVEDRFWEHMDSQFTRLESLLPVEQAASSLEAEQLMFTTRVGDGNPQSRAEDDTHGGQIVQHQPEVLGNAELLLSKSHPVDGVPERNIVATAQLRSEDMDVDMDVDMEPEDENNVGTSVVARSVDNVIPSALSMSLLYESTVPQPLMYIATPPLPQVVSYGLMESLPPEVAYIPSAQSLPPLTETPLFPVAPMFPSGAPVIPAVPSSFTLPQADSWVPPPPPEDEWAPPPLPDQEAPPPPPDEDEPPHPPTPGLNTIDVVLPGSSHPPYPSLAVPVSSSGIYYSVGVNQSSQETTSTDKHDADDAKFGLVDLDTGSVHINGNILPSSVSTVPAETTTKRSSKGRNKKRSHSTAVGASLMSNKKVSSLVNKWLAAQEELHSSDEEEEDKDLFDVEALEKKRQKEIEEWRHQTLASGGALENANFQPLGTLDWRERVKRAKKEASKLAAKQEKDAKTEESKRDLILASDESNPDVEKVAASTTPPKRPDLKDLTKDLPPGWQAFWDAESCEVYYGNLATSETSWDRPT